MMSSQELASNNNQVPEGYKKTEIGVIPEDWDVVSITKATSAIFLGLTAKVDYVNSGGIPLIRATDIASGRLKFSDARSISVRQHKQLTRYRRPKKEDVLVSKSGSLGVCAIVDVDRDFSIYESIIVIQSNSLLNSNFLLWLVRDERTQIRIIGEKVGSTVGHLNLEMFRKLLIPLPPLQEQKAIAQTLSDVDVLIAELDKLIAKKRNIKTATMQQLLTGKTRLPGFDEGKGYKKSEVGVIPEDWAFIPLKLVCKVNQGLQIAIEKRLKNQNGKAKRYITIQSLNSDANLEYIDNYASSVVCNEEDILMTRTGNTGIVITGVSGVFHNNFFKVKFDKSKIDKNYFVFCLKSNSIQKEIMEKAGTSTIPDLNHNDFYSIRVILPPLPEQRAIASVLSDMDKEIDTLEKRRTKTQAIKQGMMQELLTGRTRLI
jgi:type I restriction enzyme S subunit